MTRTCAECGRAFEARLQTAKYCGSTCRAKRCKTQAAQAVGSRPVATDGSGKPLLATAAAEEFTRRGVGDTVAALQALSVARLLDAADTADASRSPLSKEFSRLRAEALAGVPEPGDPLDAIRARVAAKRAEAPEPHPDGWVHPLSAYTN